MCRRRSLVRTLLIKKRESGRDICSTPSTHTQDWALQLYTNDDWYARLSDEEIIKRRKAYEDRGLILYDEKADEYVKTEKYLNKHVA